MEGDAAEGPVDCVCRHEMVQVLNEMKTIKAPELSDVAMELTAASVEWEFK